MVRTNGRELFFHTEDNQIMVASYMVKGDSFVADKPGVGPTRESRASATSAITFSRRTASASPP